MAENTSQKNIQERMERNVWALLIALAIVLSIAGIVEIVPLFYLKSTFPALERHPEIVWAKAGQEPIVTVDENGKEQWSWKPGDGVRPYTALELAGRDIYQREGCYTCHSQMIRPFRDEKERYGHYSLAAESMFDHPFQWGSKRTGPDLARLGGQYSDQWHIKHMTDPRSMLPESVMPNYPWLLEQVLDAAMVKRHMQAMQTVGVPYTDADIDASSAAADGKTEMDAMVAYLQVLGTMAKLDYGVVYRE